MRQTLYILILVFQFSLIADEGYYNYGIEGGINLGNIKSQDVSQTYNNRLGVCAGLYWDLFPENFISFIPGGYVIGKGYRDFDDPNQAVVLNYFELRLLGRIPIIRTNSSKFFIDFGPAGDFISQKGTQNSPSPSKLTYVRDTDVSLMGGIGFETDVSKTLRLVFNAKYHYGLFNIFNVDAISIDNVQYELPKSNNWGFLITMGLQFSTETNRVVTTEERARDYINSKSPSGL